MISQIVHSSGIEKYFEREAMMRGPSEVIAAIRAGETGGLQGSVSKDAPLAGVRFTSPESHQANRRSSWTFLATGDHRGNRDGTVAAQRLCTLVNGLQRAREEEPSSGSVVPGRSGSSAPRG